MPSIIHNVPPNPKVAQSEIQIQAACFQWTWNELPETRRCFFHVPNGGSRNKIEAIHLKASGVVPGIPDMILVWDNTAYGFEFKTETGVLSDRQKEVGQSWHAQGIIIYTIRNEQIFKSIFLSIIKNVA